MPIYASESKQITSPSQSKTLWEYCMSNLDDSPSSWSQVDYCQSKEQDYLIMLRKILLGFQNLNLTRRTCMYAIIVFSKSRNFFIDKKLHTSFEICTWKLSKSLLLYVQPFCSIKLWTTSCQSLCGDFIKISDDYL